MTASLDGKQIVAGSNDGVVVEKTSLGFPTSGDGVSIKEVRVWEAVASEGKNTLTQPFEADRNVCSTNSKPRLPQPGATPSGSLACVRIDPRIEFDTSMPPQNVALFVTCLTDQFYPQVGIAVIKILERLGCRVAFPEAQTCCGQPFFNNGFHDEARDLAKRLITIFEPYEYVVTPSGSCCAMVREQFHELLHGDEVWEPAMKKLVSRTFEFVEFLDKVLHVDLSKLKLPDKRSITYHYTCHLRGIGVKDEGVRLLKQLGNVDFRPMEKTDQCCGFGGTFAVKYPAISGAIVEDKAKCIAATEASTLICNDAGCTMNISGMCHRDGMQVRTKHIAEVIAEAMGIEIERW